MIKSIPGRLGGFASKLLLALLVLSCLALGVVGLVLPVIPGLLFLLFAALAAAKLSPRLRARMDKVPSARPWLRQGSRLSRLNFADKCRYAFWMTMQLTVDTLHLGWRALGRLRQGRSG